MKRVRHALILVEEEGGEDVGLGVGAPAEAAAAGPVEAAVVAVAVATGKIDDVRLTILTSNSQ